MINELVIIPSGSFSGYSSYITCPNYDDYQTFGRDNSLTGAIELYNPMKIPDMTVDSNIVVEESRKYAEKIFNEYKSTDPKVIDIKEVNKYADEIIKLGVSLKSIKYDVLICPLRGALKPTNYLKTMGVVENEINWLIFTGATSEYPDYNKLIIKNLKEILERSKPNSELFRISIIDTAIGGNGSNKLADLIKEVKKDYSNTSHWEVRFYLLHYPKYRSSTNKIYSIESKNSSELRFIIERFEVDNLIIEDWEAAIGLNVFLNGNSIRIKNSIQDGRIFLLDKEKVCIVDSTEISHYVDVLIASNISDAIRTHPKLTFVKEVWQDYIDK